MSQQRPYQVAGSAFLLERERAILADEPGLGKTNQALVAARGRTLVLSPASLSDVWSTESAMWKPPDAEIFWASYSGICKRIPKEPGKPASMVIPVPRDGLAKNWDTVICDEAHYLKNRSTNWTKVVSTKLKSERLYMLTGTPMPNWGHEIFMTLRMLFPGQFTNYWNWIHEWFKTWNPPWGGTQIKGLQRGVTWEEAAEAWGISGRWLRRETDEVLPDLPPMTEQVIRVKMGPKQAAAYNQMKKDYATTLDNGNELVAWTDGAKHTQLWQLSTGIEVVDPEVAGSAKLDAMMQLMQHRTRPTLIFCLFKNTAEVAAERLRKAGREVGVVSSRYSVRDRQAVFRDFQEGRYDTLAGTVGTMSEGITLTQADTCIFLERSPRPQSNFQARRRVRRFGQTRPTLAIDLVTEGTIDEGLTKLLTEKSNDTELAITGFQLAQMI